jgi:Fur family peroxide stress response transcriptional regulator
VNEVEVQENVERFEAACRAAGMNVTPQRVAVYRHLVVSDRHPTADQIFEAVRVDFPALSRATIYKALSVLCGLGFASEVGLAGGPGRFEAELEPHHHLVCTRCQEIVDIPASDVTVEAPPPRDGFAISSTRVRFDGVCAACEAG